MKNIDVIKIKDNFKCRYKEKRDCFKSIWNYLIGENNNKICAIYGLRRTGKTVLMYQCIEKLSTEQKNKTLLISCSKGSSFYDLLEIIENAVNDDYRYFFIDEITYADYFQQVGEVLANRFVALDDVRIVVAGTDSLGLFLPTHNLQYDRTLLVHTTYISFAEYSRLLGQTSFDEFMANGSVLSSDIFSDYEKTHEYINTSITENLINSLEKSEGINKFAVQLTELYDNEELQNAIERIINKYSQELTAKAIRKEFKASIVSAGVNNLIKDKDYPQNLAVLLNEEELNNQIAKSLGIIKNAELSVNITENHKKAIYDYLEEMDVYKRIPVVSENGTEQKYLELITHSGICHANVTHSVRALLNSDNWLENASLEQKSQLITRGVEYAFGNLMENIIISDTYYYLCDDRSNQLYDVGENNPNRWYVSKIGTEISKRYHEVDMLIFDKKKKETYLFEIKHSETYAESQSLHLEDKNFCEYIENRFGKIKSKIVLHNGKTDKNHNVTRMSASEFLIKLYQNYKNKNFELSDCIKDLKKIKSKGMSL